MAEEVAGLRRWLCDADRLGSRAFMAAPAYEPLENNPSRSEVEEALRDPVRPWTDADAAVVLVTGHGCRAHGHHWLVLSHTDSTRLRATALRTGDLIGWLAEVGVQHLLLIVDACFAGASMGDVASFDTDLPATWLVLPSAMKEERAVTGALTRAITRAVEKLAGGQGAKYGLRSPYFTVEQFLEAVQEFLGPTQRVEPLYGGQTRGPHLCLPNPHYSSPVLVPTQPRRHELALPARDLQTHWAPRSRGVASDAEPGWLFTGRAALMRELIATTAPDAVPGATLVTGAAGCGKSAVLARLVTLSDPDFLDAYAEQIAEIPRDLRPAVEAVDVAVLATGKSAHEILAQLLEALAVPRPQAQKGLWDISSLDERIEAWTAWLADHPSPVTLVIDALDEAHDPAAVISLLARLAGGRNASRLRLLVGVRSPGGLDSSLPGPASDDGTADGGRNGGPFAIPEDGRGSGTMADEAEAALAARRLRIDEDPWWSRDDVRAYVVSVLTNTPGSPYALPAWRGTAEQVAHLLADRAGRSFLIARLGASSLAARPEPVQVDDPAWLAAVDEGVFGVFREDLHSAFPDAQDRYRAVVLLRAVAFAYGRGLPWGDVWPLVANAVADTHAMYGDRDIAWVLASPMAAYLTTDTEEDITVYRLFHDTLRTTLRDHWTALLTSPVTAPSDREGAAADVQARITGRLSSLCNGSTTPDYVRRHLAEHAHAAGVLDGRILTVEFLPYIDPARLRPLLPTRSAPGITSHTSVPGLLEAVRHSIHRWDYRHPAANAAAVDLWAAAGGTPLPADTATSWHTVWARWPIGSGEVLSRHTGPVFAAATAVRTDGRLIAVTGLHDGTIRLTNLLASQPAGHPLTGHTSMADAVAAVVLPDGRPIAVTASADSVRVWDLDGARQIGTPLTGWTSPIRDVAAVVSPVGHPVAVTGSADGTVRVWDVNTGRRIGEVMTSHTRTIFAIAAITLPDGRLIAVTGAGDGTRIWNLDTGRPITVLPDYDRTVFAVSALVFPDGRPAAVTGSADGMVRVWDVNTGRPIGDLVTGDTDVYAIGTTVLPDGRPIAVTGSADGTVRVWNLTTCQPLGEPLYGHAGAVYAVEAAVLPDGQPVAVTGSADGTVRTWDLGTRPRADVMLTGPASMVTAVATVRFPDGRPVAVTGTADGTVQAWDLNTGQPLCDPLTGHTRRVEAVTAVTLAEGRSAAVSASDDGIVRVWDLHTGQPLGDSLIGHTRTVFAVTSVVPPDGRPIVISGAADGLRQWNLGADGASGGSLIGQAHAVFAVAATVLSDGRAIAVIALWGNEVQVWDLGTGSPSGGSLDGHTGVVFAVAATVLPDGRPIAVTGSADGTVRAWDLHVCQPLGDPLTGHTGAVNAVEIVVLPDGRPIAVTGSADGTVRAWDLRVGAQVGPTLPVFDQVLAVTALAWSADTIGVVVTGRGIAFATLRLGRDGQEFSTPIQLT
ncbi:AAA family ATPase [Streptomyces sp. NPDC002845]